MQTPAGPPAISPKQPLQVPCQESKQGVLGNANGKAYNVNAKLAHGEWAAVT